MMSKRNPLTKPCPEETLFRAKKVLCSCESDLREFRSKHDVEELRKRRYPKKWSKIDKGKGSISKCNNNEMEYSMQQLNKEDAKEATRLLNKFYYLEKK